VENLGAVGSAGCNISESGLAGVATTVIVLLLSPMTLGPSPVPCATGTEYPTGAAMGCII
jgi:hypothetical protein